jgi:hypothetical protein
VTLYDEKEELTLDGQDFHDCCWQILMPLMAQMGQKGYPVREVCHVILGVVISMENILLLE